MPRWVIVFMKTRDKHPFFLLPCTFGLIDFECEIRLLSKDLSTLFLVGSQIYTMLFVVLRTYCPFCIHYVIFGLGSSILGSLLLFACLHVLFEPAEPPHVAKESILYLKFKHLLLCCTIQRGLPFPHSHVYFPSLNSRYISFCFPLISGYCPQASFKQRPLTSS